MKATKVTEKQSFQPFQITLEFESLDEVKKFHAVFNNLPVADFVGEDTAKSIRELLRAGECDETGLFARNEHDQLCSALIAALCQR